MSKSMRYSKNRSMDMLNLSLYINNEPKNSVNWFNETSISLQILHIFCMQTINKSQLSSWVRITDDIYLDPDGILGKGCFGEVFRGYSIKQDKLVAIKTMQGQGYEREVDTLMALSSLNHPSIMGYYGFEKIKDSVYIFVQFCPNGTLTDLITEGIDQSKVLELFRQMIEGMCYMNAKAIMHRDLKPDNILIGLQKDVKISDFGLARETTGIFVTGQMGTPLYAGPEVYLNKYDEAYSQRCDVWGAGMILYEMLTQKILFQGVKTFEDLKNEWHLYEIGERRVQYDTKFHPNWEYFTNYMLTYDPKKRPTFHQILQKLKKVYDKMMQQIKNKPEHKINENTKIGRLQLFLQYTFQKYHVLTKISDNFTQKVINIRSQFKSIIQFLCLCQYVTHLKKLIRNLKYKRISVNEDDQQDLIDEDNQDCDILLDKYRNLFQHKYNFYNDQITKRIIPKLLDFSKKNESEGVFKDLKAVWELASDVSDGTFDVEQTYNQLLRSILQNKIDNYHKGLIVSLKNEELIIYHLVFIGALIETIFQNKHYLKKNFIKETLGKIEEMHQQENIKCINNLRKQL